MSAMSTKAQDLVDRDLSAARALAEAADKEQGEAEAEVAYAEAARGLEQFASDLWARESYSLDDVQALAIVAGALGPDLDESGELVGLSPTAPIQERAVAHLIRAVGLLGRQRSAIF